MRSNGLSYTNKTTPMALNINRNIFKKKIILTHTKIEKNKIHVISHSLIKWNISNSYNVSYFKNDINLLSRFILLFIPIKNITYNLNWPLHIIRFSRLQNSTTIQ